MKKSKLDITEPCKSLFGILENGYAFVLIHQETVRVTLNCWGYIDVYIKEKVGKRKYRHHYHRWLYEQQYGKLPKEIHVHHECQNKACINLHHMQPLTRSQHMNWHKEH